MKLTKKTFKGIQEKELDKPSIDLLPSPKKLRITIKVNKPYIVSDDNYKKK